MKQICLFGEWTVHTALAPPSSNGTIEYFSFTFLSRKQTHMHIMPPSLTAAQTSMTFFSFHQSPWRACVFIFIIFFIWPAPVWLEYDGLNTDWLSPTRNRQGRRGSARNTDGNGDGLSVSLSECPPQVTKIHYLLKIVIFRTIKFPGWESLLCQTKTWGEVYKNEWRVNNF